VVLANFFPAYVSWGDDANSSIVLPGTAGSTADGDITIPVILAKIDTDYSPPGLWPWFAVRAPRFFMPMTLQRMEASAMMTGDLANFARMSMGNISQLPLEQLAKIASAVEQRRITIAENLASNREARSREWSKITQWNLGTCECKMLCSENWKELKFIHQCKKHQSSRMTEMDVWNEQRDKISKKAAYGKRGRETPKGSKRDRKRKSRR
jgi:hypothetical protein